MDFSYSVNYQAMSPAAMTCSVIFGIIVIVLFVIANWRILKKASEKGWKSLIPLYNTYMLYKITFGSGWKMLLLLIPVVNIVVSIMYDFKLAKVFGKGTGFGFGILFLPNIFTLILAFGNAKYQGVQN